MVPRSVPSRKADKQPAGTWSFLRRLRQRPLILADRDPNVRSCRHLLEHPARQALVVHQKPIESSIVHHRGSVGSARGQPLLLPLAMGTYYVEVPHLEHHQHIDAIEEVGVIGGEPAVDLSAPFS